MDEKSDADVAALLSALEAGELDGAERARAEALVKSSPEARAVVERLRRLRALTGALPDPALSPAARRRAGDVVIAALDGRRRRRGYIVAATALAAAAAAIAIALTLVPRTPKPTVATEDEVRTGPGEHRLLEIGDRATAFIGERSVVRVGRSGAPLRVRSGRVRLVVKPDRDHPFVVHSDAADATVFGTEFDVDVDGDTTEVRVARGEVELRNALGARRLWAGETARARVGSAPRRIEHIVPFTLEDGPAEIEPPPPKPKRRR